MGVVSNALPGMIGLILDQEPAELAPGAWSEVLNVRFSNGAARSMLGDRELFASTEGLEYAFSITSGPDVNATWVLASGTKAFAFQSGSLDEITPAAISPVSGPVGSWNGGNLGGVTILNNGKQKPWVWFGTDTSSPMVELANWPSTLKAKVVRPFKSYLVALNLDKDGTRLPMTVKWSHPADPGDVPISWDEADPTRDAGEYTLAETPGSAVDCVPLKDVAVIYKTDSVWGMQWVGGVYIFRFYKMFGDFGMPKKDCAVEYASGRHFVFTGNDAVIHDGTSVKSVASGKVKSLFKTITTNQLATCFVISHPGQNEVWLCYRRADDGVFAADTALCYNHADDTWSMRSLPGYVWISGGNVEPPENVGANWGAITGSWLESELVWGEYSSIPAVMRLLGVSSTGITWVDGVQAGLKEAYLQREYVGIPMKTDKAPDLTTEKFVNMCWPRLKGLTGQRILLTFGTSESPAKPTRWRPTKTFTIGESSQVNITLSGKMLALRIEADPNSPVKGNWSYHGLDMIVQSLGDR